MAREFLSDAQVEEEIAVLLNDDYVKLAKKEIRIRYKRRQYLYQLRNMKKHGEELANMGVTMDNMEEVMFGEGENDEEKHNH